MTFTPTSTSGRTALLSEGPSRLPDFRVRPGTIEGLPLLLELAALARSRDDIRRLWRQVGNALARSLGFQAVAINEYRPAWEDFEAVAAVGLDEVQEATLLGSKISRDLLEHGLDERHRVHDVYLIPYDGATDLADYSETIVVTDTPQSEEDPWHPDDALVLPLRTSAGEPLALLFLDAPIDGRRPDEETLAAASAISAVAASVVEHAHLSARAAGNQRAVEHLLRVSSELRGDLDREQMLHAVCEGVREALGFQCVSIRLDEGDGAFEVVAGACANEAETRDPVAREGVERMLAAVDESEGCVLIDGETGRALGDELAIPVRHRSQNNGRGSRGWDRHWLMVPLRGKDGSLIGVLAADDPADHLLPSVDDLRALRTFANDAVTAIETAASLDRFRFLAERDPLTSLRNRRGFESGLAEVATPAAMVIFDLDGFKRINDNLGLAAGDLVLRRFAELVVEEADGRGRPARLGGEEFALTLTGEDTEAASELAERIRRRTPEILDDLPVTVSAGIAAAAVDSERDGMLRDAGRALNAAKRLGRDRSVVYDSGTLALLNELENEGADRQVSAAILLAETLDLRDRATANHSKTVGGLAEDIARGMGLAEERVERLRVAGLVHDIGKIGIADSILLKPGRLTEEEFAEIERHPEIGARILEHANLREVAAWVLGHHERVDGAGYPRGLRGAEIPLEARILAVADSFEAMIAERPYRSPMTRAEALVELRRCAGTQFDPAVVAVLARTLGEAT